MVWVCAAEPICLRCALVGKTAVDAKTPQTRIRKWTQGRTTPEPKFMPLIVLASTTPLSLIVTTSSIATTACVTALFASIHQQKQRVSFIQFQVLRLRGQHNLSYRIRVSRVCDEQIVDAIIPARVNVKSPQRGWIIRNCLQICHDGSLPSTHIQLVELHCDVRSRSVGCRRHFHNVALHIRTFANYRTIPQRHVFGYLPSKYWSRPALIKRKGRLQNHGQRRTTRWLALWRGARGIVGDLGGWEGRNQAGLGRRPQAVSTSSNFSFLRQSISASVTKPTPPFESQTESLVPRWI